MASAWESADTRRAERTRAAFFEVSRRLSAARTPEEAARIIVGVAQELLGWDACTLDLYFPETNQVQDVLTMDSFDGPPRGRPAAPTRRPRPTPDVRAGAPGGRAAHPPARVGRRRHRRAGSRSATPPAGRARSCSCRAARRPRSPACSPSRATRRTRTTRTTWPRSRSWPTTAAAPSSGSGSRTSCARARRSSPGPRRSRW